MKIVNLTSDVISIHGMDGKPILNINPSGRVLRANINRVEVDSIDIGISIPVYESLFWWNAKSFPDPEDNTIFIVSNDVYSKISNRPDVYRPGKLLYNSDDGVIRCVGIERELITVGEK